MKYIEFGNGIGVDWGTGGNVAEFYFNGAAKDITLPLLGGVSKSLTISVSLGKVLGGSISAL